VSKHVCAGESQQRYSGSDELVLPPIVFGKEITVDRPVVFDAEALVRVIEIRPADEGA
jgi:hypothetical protein